MAQQRWRRNPEEEPFSDSTAIIQVQLLQQPQQQQQQQGHRTDNMHWKFKGNALDETAAQLQRQIKLNSSASTAHLECKTFLGSVQPSVRRVSASQEGKRRKQNCVAIVSPDV
ncbi:hypothetical protein NQZ68_002616 [Dissostichus eleginoides]|nr:hypothetical protein NQZ68_002616 [Dissostichus eleginoides]